MERLHLRMGLRHTGSHNRTRPERPPTDRKCAPGYAPLASQQKP